MYRETVVPVNFTKFMIPTWGKNTAYLYSANCRDIKIIHENIHQLQLPAWARQTYSLSPEHTLRTSFFNNHNNVFKLKDLQPSKNFQQFPSALKKSHQPTIKNKTVHFADTVEFKEIEPYCNKNNQENFFYKINSKNRRRIRKTWKASEQQRQQMVRENYKKSGYLATEALAFDYLTLKNTQRNTSNRSPVAPRLMETQWPDSITILLNNLKRFF
ncbi:MAG: hypothetical protein AB2989_05790 [Candidatus Symbiodolus clandestinus]